MKNELIIRRFKGKGIEFKVIDGVVYANANKMAKAFGGSIGLDNWKRSDSTKRYISALESNRKFHGSNELMKIRKGGNATEQGTWIHEKLVLNFARYLDVNFELWCDEQITTLLREGINKAGNTQNKRLEIMEMNAKVRMSKQFENLAKNAKTDKMKTVLLSYGANVLAGTNIVDLPTAEHQEKTYSAAEIGEILGGLSSNKIGRIAQKYGLKTEENGIFVHDKSRYSNKEVESFRYYEKVLEEFKKYI